MLFTIREFRLKKSELMTTNPLLRPFTEETPDLFPAFDQIKPSDFRPALNFTMAETRRLVKKITTSKDEPTFENTVKAFENATSMMDYVFGIFSFYTYACRSEEIEELEEKLYPKLIAFYNDIYKDEALYRRLKKLETNKDKLPLDQNQKYLIEVYAESFRANGCGLSAKKKQRLREISSELEDRGLEFDNNLQDARKTYGMVIENIEDLDGVPDLFIQSAAEEAEKRGMPGKWVLTAEEPIEHAIAFYAKNRELRERHYKDTNDIGTELDSDNFKVMKKILKLRYETAQIFGYRSYLDLAMTYNMSLTRKPVFDFLKSLKEKSAPTAKRQHLELKQYARADGVKTMEPWDLRFYLEKMKKERLHFNSEMVRPYFPLHGVLQGAFQHCEKMFGVRFSFREDYPTLASDVFTFDVKDAATGDLLGTLIIDPYLRDNKISGNQFCVSIHTHGQYGGKASRALSAVHLNFQRPTKEYPTLLSEEDVKTVFHELGHAMHQMLGKTEHRLLSGMNCIMPDFGELPSQLNEVWALEPEVLKNYAFHYQTGEVMPVALMNGLQQNNRFMGCHKMLREVRRAYVDLAIHGRNPDRINLRTFEARFQEENFPQVNFKNLAPFLPRFSHIASIGMEANYYAYLWSEALDADAEKMFRKTGDMYDPESCQKFRDMLKAAGTALSSDLYRKFSGHDIDTQALLERYGIGRYKPTFNFAALPQQAANDSPYIEPQSPPQTTVTRRKRGNVPTPS